MEMSNSFIPELHVAQQRRRDKLRIQHFEELEQTSNNFHHHNNNDDNDDNNNNNNSHNASQMMLLSPEMLNFAVAASHSSNPFPNIHPTRFIAPSSSDSCDPSQQQQQNQQQLQNCESWVPNFGMDGDDHQQHQGRRHLTSVVVPQFLGHHHSSHDQTPEIEFHNSVQNWGQSGGNNELPLLPGNFVSHQQPLNNGITSHPHHARGLSLSLSSNQICEYQQQRLIEPRELKPFETGSISSVAGSHVQDVAGSSIHQVHRNVGPLGPFTGYATILKNSKFLKPAQKLLDEFFGPAGLCRVGEDSENNDLTSRSHNLGDCSTALVSKFHGSSNDLSGGSSSCESYRPDCHERKAKLLHMQEEVCKRHKQYHEQMQMVMSAFESVPGLGNATPYIVRSLKTISKHFRCLKNAIADQLKLIKRALGEDLSSPTSFLKGDSSSSLRYESFARVKSGAVSGSGHLGHQTHVWRPQRGLPERAVAILRAWLFDHFLHPYPTDNDKQLLATQTGLTRNQVSNWFINARVRLWKPMVEEIHMLETKSSSRSEPNLSNSEVSAVMEKHRQLASGNQSSGCKPPLNPVCDRKQLECSGPSSTLERSRGHETSTEQLFQKCSRIESHHQVPDSMDSSFIGFLPYQRRELGGIGDVSLTLGLRHGSENPQQQLQHQFLPQGVPFSYVIQDFSG